MYVVWVCVCVRIFFEIVKRDNFFFSWIEFLSHECSFNSGVFGWITSSTGSGGPAGAAAAAAAAAASAAALTSFLLLGTVFPAGAAFAPAAGAAAAGAGAAAAAAAGAAAASAFFFCRTKKNYINEKKNYKRFLHKTHSLG